MKAICCCCGLQAAKAPNLDALLSIIAQDALTPCGLDKKDRPVTDAADPTGMRRGFLKILDKKHIVGFATGKDGAVTFQRTMAGVMV